MNTLVIGAAGQVGSALCAAHTAADNLCGTYYTSGTYFSNVTDGNKLDVSNKVEVGQLFASLDEPDVVYMAAACANVDLCEQDPQAAWRVNVLGVKNIVDMIKGSEINFVFYSSDFIFDGKEGLYAEDSLPNPINEYGRQKLIAEHYIASNLEKYYIVRTNVVYGPDPRRRNFILRAMDKLRAGESINVPMDEWVTPTYTPDLANISIDLAKSGQPSGIYHVGGLQVVNRYKFALAAAKAFELDERLVVPVQSHTLGRPARRPLNAGLKITTSIPACCGYEEGLVHLRELEMKHD